ncbi:MAG: hypothetical protein R3264_13715 [Anaerolineae bacterium]|nr:hypothetical protein [Anaerolineae bacterium]
MRSKTLLVTALALLSLAVLVVASTVTAFALTMDDATLEVEQAVEIIPLEAPAVEVEAIHNVEVIEPVFEAKSIEKAAGAGCPYSHAKPQEALAEPVLEVGDKL